MSLSLLSLSDHEPHDDAEAEAAEEAASEPKLVRPRPAKLESAACMYSVDPAPAPAPVGLLRGSNGSNAVPHAVPHAVPSAEPNAEFEVEVTAEESAESCWSRWSTVSSQEAWYPTTCGWGRSCAMACASASAWASFFCCSCGLTF